MRLRLLAVGTRMPGWVTEAFADYSRRLSASLHFSLHEIEPGRRGNAVPASRAIAEEAQRFESALKPGEFIVALDERGKELSTRELADWLAQRMQDGRDVAVLIGGADGLATPLRERADQRWSLSRLTLPHAMVRVLVAEQLYRAQSLLANHPYHRD